MNPQSSTTTNLDNIIYGYYADGFVDRRAIVTGPNSGTASSAVSATTSAVAYIGNLLFNPASRASLFFPSACQRNTAGTLVSAGGVVFYWSSSSTDPNNSWFLRGSGTNLFVGKVTTSNAFPVRCVAP